MWLYPRCIAPTLLASLIGLAAAAAARAEPAPIASSASAECLAKPSGAATPGNHWYFHSDRASGQKCWYQRPVNGAQTDAGQPRSAPARVKPAAVADQPAPAGPADKPAEARDGGAAEPVAAPAAPPTAPLSAWPEAPAAAPAIAAPAAAPAAPPAVEPAMAEPPAAPASAAVAERQAPPAEASTHMPALLGAALALVIIVVGSIALRRAARWLRSRRRGAATSSDWGVPIERTRDAPSLVPHMPPEGEIAAAEPNADRTRVLEENVRDLLRRLREDQQARPRPSGATAVVQPPAAQELDQVLAMWRARRSGSAG
jgi:hypothetical protein